MYLENDIHRIGHIGGEEYILWLQIKSIYVFIIIYKDNVTYLVTALRQRGHVYGKSTIEITYCSNTSQPKKCM